MAKVDGMEKVATARREVETRMQQELYRAITSARKGPHQGYFLP
jgi:hypothetical protein